MCILGWDGKTELYIGLWMLFANVVLFRRGFEERFLIVRADAPRRLMCEEYRSTFDRYLEQSYTNSMRRSTKRHARAFEVAWSASR